MEHLLNTKKNQHEKTPNLAILVKDNTSPTDVTPYTGHWKSPRLSWVFKQFQLLATVKWLALEKIRECSQEVFLLQTGGNTAPVKTEEMGGLSGRGGR